MLYLTPYPVRPSPHIGINLYRFGCHHSQVSCSSAEINAELVCPLRTPNFPPGTHDYDPKRHDLIEGVSKCMISRQEAQAKFNEFREAQGSHDEVYTDGSKMNGRVRAEAVINRDFQNGETTYRQLSKRLPDNSTIFGVSPMCPSPFFPSPYVPCFMILVPIFPMFPSPYVTQKYSLVPLFPKLTLPSPCSSPVPMFPIFPSPNVSQSRCSPVPVLPSSFVSQSSCSPVPMFTNPYVPQSYSTEVFSIPYIPQTCSPVPMFPYSVSSPYVNMDWGTQELVNSLGEHRDWGICLGNINWGK